METSNFGKIFEQFFVFIFYSLVLICLWQDLRVTSTRLSSNQRTYNRSQSYLSICDFFFVDPYRRHPILTRWNPLYYWSISFMIIIILISNLSWTPSCSPPDTGMDLLPRDWTSCPSNFQLLIGQDRDTGRLWKVRLQF